MKFNRLNRDFFLDKKREKAKLEAEMKLQVTLKQLIPACEAKPVAPLGVILSQYYLNLAEFCNHFNKETAHWEDGVLMSVKVKKGLRAKEYKLIISPPPLSFYIWNAINEDNNELTYLALWDVVRLKVQDLKLNEKTVANFVLASLLSSHNYHISFNI